MAGRLVAVKIAWPRAHRIVSRQDAPISAFDKLVDNPLELEALLRVEALTNPLARDAFKTLPAIPVSRRYNGPLAGLIMTPFVIPRTSRFSNGSYGVLYAGYEENTALRESAHHQSLRLNASKAPAGIAISMHGFLVDVRADVTDIRHGMPDVDARIYDPDDYAVSAAFGRDLRDTDAQGVAYSSVRNPGGTCIGVFWPDAIRTAARRDRWLFYWDGSEISKVARVHD